MGKRKHGKYKRAFPLYIMVAPGFLYLLINNYVPMTGIIIAFKHLNFAKEFCTVTRQGFPTLNICLKHRMQH